MAISSRSPRRGDPLARLQSSDTVARLHSPNPPWLPPTTDVVSGPDRDPGEPLIDRDPSAMDPLEHDRFEYDDTDPDPDPAPMPPDTGWIDGAAPPQWDRAAPPLWPESAAPPRWDRAAPPQWDRAAPPRWDRAAPPRWLDGPGDLPTDDPPPIERRPRSPRRRRGPLMAPPAAIALVGIGVLACVVTVYTVASGSSDDAPTVVAFPSSAGAAAPESGTNPGPAATDSPASEENSNPSEKTSADRVASPNEMVVSVVGLVRTPGLVHLPGSARIADAISAAGGGRPGADMLSLNMAQPVRDGDQILVGFADPSGGPRLRSAVVSIGGAPPVSTGSAPSGPGPAAPSSAGASGAGKVDLNTADVAALDTLPGVGPVTAAAIADWRTRNGKFTSVDQLAEVDGIGPGRLAKLRDRVTV